MNKYMKRFVEETGLNDDNPNVDKFSDAYTWLYKEEYGDWLEKRLADKEETIEKLINPLSDEELSKVGI